jgi:hypothetical protein
MKKIQVQIRTLYGNRVIYPACEVSRNFARIAGTKTLTPLTLRQIQALGYEIEETYPAQLQEILEERREQ